MTRRTPSGDASTQAKVAPGAEGSRPGDPSDAGTTAGPSEAAPEPQERVKVLYIAGIGRSGSTLLARALGGADGLAAVGEAMHFYGRGLTNNELCACGQPVHDCPLWGRVAERLGEAHRPLPSARIERFRHRATEGRGLPATFLPWRTPGFEENLESFRSHLSRLYVEARRVAGARALVDSSKNAGYARVLLGVPRVDLHLIHLIRDSRGVANSLQKRKHRPGVPWRNGDEVLDRRGPAAASVFWSAAQLMVESLRSDAAGYVRVRYRDFVRAPERTLRRVLEAHGEYRSPAQLDHVEDGALELEQHHILAGNPMRNEAGTVPLDEDVAWRRNLGTGARRLVTAVTLPLLARYGYLGSSPPGNREADRPGRAGHDDRRLATAGREGGASEALDPRP